MDAKCLMIDDWVKCVDSTHTISVFAQVDAIEEGHDCILVKRDISNWFLDIKYLEPIPLTKEILEKNGFLHSMSNNDWTNDKVDFILVEHGDGYRVQNTSMTLLNVHEFQHALRLCGIEKKIEL